MVVASLKIGDCDDELKLQRLHIMTTLPIA